jgi:hypothetical protein
VVYRHQIAMQISANAASHLGDAPTSASIACLSGKF